MIVGDLIREVVAHEVAHEVALKISEKCYIPNSTRIRAIRRPSEEDRVYDVFHVLPNTKVVNT